MQSCESPEGWGNLQIWEGKKRKAACGQSLLPPIPPVPSLTINRLAGPVETMVCLFSAEGACIGGLADLSKWSD